MSANIRNQLRNLPLLQKKTGLHVCCEPHGVGYSSIGSIHVIAGWHNYRTTDGWMNYCNWLWTCLLLFPPKPWRKEKVPLMLTYWMPSKMLLSMCMLSKLLWQFISHLICVRKSHWFPGQIHVMIIPDLTWRRRVFCDNPCKFLDGQLKTCVPLTFQQSLGTIIRQISLIWIILSFLVCRHDALYVLMCTLVQNPGAFWFVRVMGSSDMDI